MNPADASSLPTGLIGNTGFVGGALLRQARFDACFNSANIAAIEGQAFGTLVCAAAPGSMVEANRAPEWDKAQINALIARLDRVEAERFVLISSIAVLADFAGRDVEGTAAYQQELAYGRNRRMLETFVERRFPASLIIRLPALFGAGLRKDFLFDLAILDWNLAGQSSRRVAVALRALAIPFVYCTGYSDPVADTPELGFEAEIVPKPASAEGLAAALRRAMSASRSDTLEPA